MGRPIKSIAACSLKLPYEKVMELKLHKIDSAEVYISDDDRFVLVAPQEWCDYLHGRTDVIPDMAYDAAEFTLEDLDQLFEFR